jgi:hypothetical protein
MKIQINNYEIMMKKQNLKFNLLMNFIDEQEIYDLDKINQYSKHLNSIYSSHNSYNGIITIKTKTLALLKLSKKEIKNIIKQDSIFFNIYNNDFKTIYNKIKKLNNPELNELKLFFQLSIKLKTDFIALVKEQDILRL